MTERFNFSASIGYVKDGEHDKFYQVITIADREKHGRGVVVTHWGKNNKGARLVPGAHGQHKVEVMESGVFATARAAIRNKEKRGYSTFQETENHNLFDLYELDGKLNDWFHPKGYSGILGFFEHDKGIEYKDESVPEGAETIDFGMPSFVSKKDEVAPKRESATSATHEGWGAW